MSQPAAQDHMVGIGARHGEQHVRGSVIAALAAGLAMLALLFLPEIRAAVEVWNASTAYSHCYLVLPMSLYLIWDRRAALAHSTARPEPILALVAVPIATCWLVAERLGIMEGRQLMAIAGVELLLITVLGRRLFWQISGPLLFLFFLVPFGAFLTPALQRFTAAFSIMGLDLLGIANYSDKFTIETSAGIFFVAEACAGLRFLIAAIAFGVFYALLNYTSPARRCGFIVASIIVPIIANGFRALGIVVLGQVLGSAEAAAADHVVYGWVFFSIVMLLLIAAGQAFREERVEDGEEARVWAAPGRERSPIWGALAAVVLLGVGPVGARAIDARSLAPPLPSMDLLAVPAGCSALPTEESGTSQRSRAVVCDGTRFDISVTLFPSRSTSSALIAERRRVGQEIGAEDVTAAAIDTPESAGRWTAVQTTDPDRVTAFASWVDGQAVQSALEGRIAQARDSLLGASYSPALVTVTTAEPPRSPPAQRKATLDRLTAFVQGQAGLDARMNAATRLGGK